jgi:hypothetical protein
MKPQLKGKKTGLIFSFAASILLIVLISSFASAIESNLTYDPSSIIQIRSLKYEPYPVNPGEYFDFWANVQYVGNTGSALTFKLNPKYPFSLDPNESAVQDYGVSNSPSIVLHYKIRVDQAALEGTNELELDYQVNGNWYSQSFDIEVQNSQTNFDAVIQDISGSDVSIAIANIGKYAANSVIVRIPDQDSFRTTSVDGQMVGNLESGDYTIVSFTLSPKANIASSPAERTNRTSQQPAMQTNSTLKFDVYYTDNIGERRIINMELPLNMNSNLSSSAFATGTFTGRRTRSSWSAWYTILIILGALLIAGFIFYKKSPKKAKSFFGKFNPRNWHKKKNSSAAEGNIPNWIKNAKEKEKK